MIKFIYPGELFRIKIGPRLADALKKSQKTHFKEEALVGVVK